MRNCSSESSLAVGTTSRARRPTPTTVTVSGISSFGLLLGALGIEVRGDHVEPAPHLQPEALGGRLVDQCLARAIGLGEAAGEELGPVDRAAEAARHRRKGVAVEVGGLARGQTGKDREPRHHTRLRHLGQPGDLAVEALQAGVERRHQGVARA